MPGSHLATAPEKRVVTERDHRAQVTITVEENELTEELNETVDGFLQTLEPALKAPLQQQELFGRPGPLRGVKTGGEGGTDIEEHEAANVPMSPASRQLDDELEMYVLSDKQPAETSAIMALEKTT